MHARRTVKRAELGEKSRTQRGSLKALIMDHSWERQHFPPLPIQNSDLINSQYMISTRPQYSLYGPSPGFGATSMQTAALQQPRQQPTFHFTLTDPAADQELENQDFIKIDIKLTNQVTQICTNNTCLSQDS